MKDVKIGDADNALKHLEAIKDVENFKDEIELINDECREIKILQKAYEEDNFKLCYELLDMHKNLKSTKLGSLLEKHWLKLISKCEEYALHGDIKSIKETLGELMMLSSRRTKIGDLLRVSFQTKIQLLISTNKAKHAENIIYSYIDIFGIDKEIKSIMKTYERKFKTKLAITYNENNKASRNSWINSTLITGHLKTHP